LWGWLEPFSSREGCRLFSGERQAVVTAVYILNHSPTKALDGRTPYEAWHWRKPTVSHLQVFVCLTFAKELGHIGKLNDRSTPGVFISYMEGSMAYRILDPKTQRVRTARDVVFNEWRGWEWDKAVDDGSTPTYDDFIAEYVHFKEVGGVGSSSSSSMPISVPESPSTPASATPTGSTTLSNHCFSCNEFFADSTAARDAMYSSHSSGLVYSSTSSRRAQPGEVCFPTLSR
jgi:hypothetical protein